jgi:tRNA (guanine10-N2)-dimethyltransferase
MELLFYLSGEHETLPRAEVCAVLESVGVEYKMLDSFEQAFVVDVGESLDLDLDVVQQRLGMTHAICEFLGSCENQEDEVLRLGKTIGTKKESFAVRIKRIKKYGGDLSTLSLEREVGSAIWSNSNAKVNLESPGETILGIVSEKFAIGRVLKEVNRSQYEERRPHKRAYFHPGAMLPRL